jgi:DNA-binding MarR family transcriptional regulator
MNRERLLGEILILLPVLWRGVGRPDPIEMGEIARRGIPVDAHVSPGHVQILIALSQGPHSVGQLAEVLGVSRPATTRLVDRLVEHGMVERRQDPEDRRVVLVDYVPGMQDIARRITQSRRRQLAAAMEPLTDEETRAFAKGLKLLVESFGAAPGEEG